MMTAQKKTRPNAKQRIIEVAFENFILHGYDGTSLSTIAEAVGIRKASIYTHFDSKDTLFLHLLNEAVVLESEYIEHCFSSQQTEELPGENYCHGLKPRYLQSMHLRFLTRMAYFPAQHLIEPITSGYIQYLDVLKKHMHLALSQTKLNAEDIELYTDAYLGILDSLSVELVYGEMAYERRLVAMLKLYHDSLMPKLHA